MTFQYESNINTSINKKGETGLHVFAKQNLKSSAKNLIKAGANVNAKCNQLETPLHKAVQEIHGANLN